MGHREGLACIFLCGVLAMVAPVSAGGKYAYATLLTTEDYGYVIGAEVLAKALRSLGSQVPLVCLVSSDLKPAEHQGSRPANQHARLDIHDRLVAAGYSVRYVRPLLNPQASLEREWFRTTYTKLHVWNLTDFDVVVYLDADVLVLKSLDALFSRGVIQVGASPDMLPPDQFQSGVLVVRPSTCVFRSMKRAMGELSSYDGGDQGFLNSFFPHWYRMPASERLPFEYNVIQTMSSLYPPAWRRLRENQRIYVLHFSGDNPGMKPWFGGERVIAPGLAPYIWVWQQIAAVVQRQVAAVRQMPRQGTLFVRDASRAARLAQTASRAEFSFNFSSVQAVLSLTDPTQIQQLFKPKEEL